MRYTLVCLLVSAIAACGNSSSGDDDGDDLPAFSIQSSDITLAPGEESTKCFYFHTTNTEAVAVNKWVSTMTPGSHHMIFFRNLGSDQPADGTIDEACGSGSAIPLPVYGTQIPYEEVAFPSDDGTGKPLGQDIEPNTAGWFQMHYLNATDQPIVANVKLEAYSLPANVVDELRYTRTDLFATYNNDIAIPPGAVGHVESATCDVVGGKFWSMSSHSHKQSVATKILDGNSEVFASTDWEHPGTRSFETPTFYQFSGQITWSCTYDNTGTNAERTVRAGQSAQTDEMCMATGYFFPSAGPRGCFMNGGECTCFL